MADLFCMNCKHRKGHGTFMKCKRYLRVHSEYWVTDGTKHTPQWCTAARAIGGDCGRLAIGYEPKLTKWWRKRLTTHSPTE